jgi:hypothetical protein
MANKADFYIGRGPMAEWVGSIQWDGYRDGLPRTVLEAETEEEYRAAVASFLKGRADSVTPEKGWPWPWEDSRGTNYAYAFDEGEVWGSCHGSSWWKARKKEPEHTSLKRGIARFPDMSLVKKMTSSPDGGGILIIEKGAKRRRRRKRQ